MSDINYYRNEVIQTLESVQFDLNFNQQSEYYELKQALDDLDSIQAEPSEYSHLVHQARNLKDSVQTS